MLVAFLQVLLTMLQAELEEMAAEGKARTKKA
jgi:hypothetical protein